jgi:uncharacterized UBP type Zn finger protein
MRPGSSGMIQIANQLKQLIDEGEIDSKDCSHLTQVQDVTPSAMGCEDCLKIGDKWVHLRICLTCGHVGCCDNSKNRHATRHYKELHHPMISSFEPGEQWVWCYQDRVGFEI